MSASREKKRRQEFLAANGGVDPKAVREAEKRAAEKKSSILYTCIAAAFIVVAAAMLIFNSGIVQRSRAAVIIDGEKYNAADVSYFYNSAYQHEMSNGYGSYFIDTSKPLGSQAYWADSSITWADYFKDQAVSSMKLVHIANKSAKAEGVVLTDEDRASIEETISSMKAQASDNGYSYKGYLQAIYGSTMTPAIFAENLERDMLAYKYRTAYYENLSFSEDEITAYYEAHKNTFDTVDGAYVTINGAAPTKDADGNTITPTVQDKENALETAKTAAEAILDGYKNGGDLETLAGEHSATYTGAADLTYATGTADEWLFDASRTAGDAEILFNETTSTYYVAVFNSREREDALSYNVRHILITEKNLNLAEGEEAAEGAVLAKAQEILDSWDGTEDGFAALAKEFTQDGNGAVGGIYEDVLKGEMVENFEDWCYAEGRKAGDTGIVETNYGQHIMYFVGYGSDEYWHTGCENSLINEAYEAWQTELSNSVTAELQSGMDAVG